ncbi:hypothetical protein GHT09_011806 [Marmota monax]|uniref:RGS domain-containing protein n=1 Tax=Marmota monax TaxID=9995 RepID=A0A834PN52_MARMO|nr:hypothetical protein GHT09_011806 [Marmota monax]
MPKKRLTAEPPDITEEEFTFSEAIRFNVDFGVFEVINDAPQLLEKQLKKILQSQQPRNPIYDVVRKGKNDVKPIHMSVPSEDETINVNYNIMCLNREQESFIFDDGVHPRTKKSLSKIAEFEEEEEGSISLKDTPSHALLRVYLEKQRDAANEKLTLHFSTCEEFLNLFIYSVLRAAIQQITGQPLTESPDYIDFDKVDQVSFPDYFYPFFGKNVLAEPVQTEKEKKSEEILEKTSSTSESIGPESRADWCMSHRTYDIGNRKEFERFKKFMKGTLGEKYLWLWMDIERLKVLKDPGRHQRAPRFCVTHSPSTKHATAELKFWHLRQEKPRKDIDPFPQMATLLPLRPKSCIPHITEVQKEDFSLLQLPKSAKKLPRVKTATQKPLKNESLYLVSSKDDGIEKGSMHISESSKVIRLTSFTDISECLKPQLDTRFAYTEEPKVKTIANIDALGGYDMENLLQSLYVENRAGFFFTKFCEDSGNKLWKNCVYFWFDLQAYHQLFYQETLQPFKVCKQAQVELVEETRQLDSSCFRKLRALHKETLHKKDEGTTGETGTSVLSLSNVYKETEYWNNVPEEYKHFRFNDLLNNKLEFEHFRQFLEAHSSSMDLMCWIDIEQFRRITYSDLNQREAKSVYIKKKYLNKKYFFGPNSPATPYQQNQIMHLSGGWGKILHEQLDASILIEIQKHVLNRLENVWLPLFLASEQFAARQKIKVQMKDIADELLLQKHERKIGIWKPVESKWISSWSDIIAFRKALLNPVTARQFQRFVALKGDLLENGVLFWQEVQKYKDLCHSHCDGSVIQKKITTIINCFINSYIPPALQIDIPVEQAQKIIEHRKELGPYIFREAQMTILGVLFKFWPQFCEFRKNLTDEKIMSVLERRQEYSKKIKSSSTDDEKLGKFGIKQYGSTTGSATKSALVTEPLQGLQAYGRQPTWCYSKYIEALEQERVLLKIQEELERKMLAGTSSLSNLFRPSGSVMSLKKTWSTVSLLRIFYVKVN